MYSYFPKGELNAVFGIEDLSKQYDDNLPSGLGLKNILLHLTWKKYLPCLALAK